MRTFIFTALACLLFVGCTTVPSGFHQVWIQSAPPPADLVAPVGFKITPLEAYQKLAKLDSDYAKTDKHVWHIYADSRAYYFLDIDSIADASERSAYVYGFQIEGQQGLIVIKDAHHYY
jgi:hypothetical protein